MTDPQNQTTTPTYTRKRFPKRVLFFGTCAVVAILIYTIANASSFSHVFARLGEVLTPIIIGCVIAYLCNPILKFYEYVVFRRLGRGNLRRGLSLLLTTLTAVGIIAVILALIVPELVENVTNLVTNYETYINQLLGFIQSIIDNFDLNVDISDMEKVNALLEEFLGAGETLISQVLSFLSGYLFNGDIVGNLWSFLGNLFNTFKNLILGIFIAFYILSSKEKRKAQIKKFRAAFFTDSQNATISEVTELVDRTFGGFVKGLLLDALAVGVVTFILMSLFRVSEYNLLIAAICAVTNIIPVFGPFIGAIPSALIVLISNPGKVLVFIVLVLIIQQIDGNILCPIIQGNNTGVSSLAVLISITIMGGFFGLLGMIIGVPVFAVIIELVKRAIEKRLRKQGKSTDTTDYYPSNAVGNAEEEVYYEHAHWKYKYDHSRIKPHIDKMLAAIGLAERIDQTDETPEPTAPAETVEAVDNVDSDDSDDNVDNVDNVDNDDNTETDPEDTK